MKKLVIATHNPAKFQRYKTILSEIPKIIPLSLTDLGISQKVEECKWIFAICLAEPEGKYFLDEVELQEQFAQKPKLPITWGQPGDSPPHGRAGKPSQARPENPFFENGINLVNLSLLET